MLADIAVILLHLLLYVGSLLFGLIAITVSCAARCVHVIRKRHGGKRDVSGKWFIVTGAAGGFGAETTAKLLALGAKVLAVDVVPSTVTKDRVESLAATYKLTSSQLINMIPATCDVSKAADITRFVSNEVAVPKREIYGLINNAGISGNTPSAAVEHTEESMRTVFDVNFFGIVTLSNLVFPHMTRGSQEAMNGGRIVNIASCAGLISGTGMSAYSASKFALESYSDSCRLELKQFGIGVAIIEPYFAATNIVMGLTEQKGWKEAAERSILAQHWAGALTKIEQAKKNPGELMSAAFVADRIVQAAVDVHMQDRYLVTKKLSQHWAMRFLAHAPNYFMFVDKMKTAATNRDKFS